MTRIKSPRVWLNKVKVCFPAFEDIPKELDNLKLRKAQGWNSLKYRELYLIWARSVGEMDLSKANHILLLIYEKFLHLKNIPNFTFGGRVWKTQKFQGKTCINIAVRYFNIRENILIP